ncbi:hypothetical protein [Roseicella aquatilis]|uniref:Anti-sigma factor NepR domain-containing protein n=1 Tax=Roseicella aquatilis TaxID=2527868 RepID=A0A4R4DTN1_9PROT|nr:hypothetical protein [Roseicella aquatilis]TCZ65382.1 hypothetical protein EXY23_04200 [Roseicella aquatilis]
MSDPKPNPTPGGTFPRMEPAARPGIGKDMQDLALSPQPDGRFATPAVEAPEFDIWLRRHLSGLHADLLSEPVPDRLLRLLDGLRA